MSVCIHGNLCKEIYKKTGYIHSKSCPSSCSFFEEKCKSISTSDIDDIKSEIKGCTQLKKLDKDSPCDLCRFNSQKDSEGKICIMCPTEATDRFQEKLKSGYFRERKDI